ncbi:hypothetical protein JST99_04705 [Candidatus Dependentiae bacterium]|nr:hypothetical protein [Candidatus Dependentiae bacterium]MCC7414649.1 hypothetical protein [Campylobacterota bacterium]
MSIKRSICLLALISIFSMHVGDSLAVEDSDESKLLEPGLSPLRYRQQLENDATKAWSLKEQSDNECAHAIKSARKRSCLKVCSVMTCTTSFALGLAGWGFPAALKALNDASKCD